MAPIASTATTILARTAGLAGAAAVFYDAHKCGKQDANTREYKEASKLLEEQYWNSQTQDSRSTIVSKLKDKLFDVQIGSTANNFFSRAKGYISGFGTHAISNVLTLGLSAGALFLKKGHKVCGVGLALVGVKTLLYDVCGIGKKKA